MARTPADRLEAIPAAIEAGRAFRVRVKEAEGDAVRCADLMAEAIALDREQRSLDRVGRDGRMTVSVEYLESCYNLDAARAAYLEARGSNAPTEDKSSGLAWGLGDAA